MQTASATATAVHTPAMHQITVRRATNHGAEVLWALLADFGAVHRYSGGVESSPINPGTPTTGLGAERNCKLYDGNHIQERITEFVEREALGLEVFDTSMPLDSGNARFSLSPTKNGGCEVTMTMNYVVKWGPLGRLLNTLMLRRAMTSSLERLLEGMDGYASTGTPIGKGGKAI